MPIKKKVDTDFFKTWSSDMAYVLGFFFADGSMDINPRGSHYFSFQICDRKLLYDIRTLLGSNHKIATRKKRNKNWNTQYRLQIGSKKMCEDLMQFGVTPQKTKFIAFPKIPKKYLPDFIKGYFDGDGCVHLGNYYRKDRERYYYSFTTRFTANQKSFLATLHVNLRDLGISGGYLYKKKRGWELVFSRKDSLALFHIIYNNSHCSIKLERKYRKFLKAFAVLNFKYEHTQR